MKTSQAKSIHSTAPLIRLEIINGQIKLIITDVIGGDGNPRNIKINKNVLTIQYEESKKTFSYKFHELLSLMFPPQVHGMRTALQGTTR